MSRKLLRFKPRGLMSVLLAGMIGLTLAFRLVGSVSAAACPPPATDYGSATNTALNIPSAGTYRIWSRLKASSTDSNANSYMLEIDGNTCLVIGDSTSISGSQWTWVDYRDGSSSTKATHAFGTGGNHTVKLIGREAGVRLDRVVFTTDVNCVPTGFGDNCANPPDTTAPIVSLTTPQTGATVTGTATLQATATDDETVTKVEFYLDSQLVQTDTTAPYAASVNTTTLGNGSHILAARAYDAAGNNATSASVTVTVQNAAPAPPPPPPSPTPTPPPPTPAPAPTPPPTPPPPTFKSADINQDGKVNIFDFSLLVAKFGQAGSNLGRTDINQDAKVNIFDFSILVAQFGT